MIAAADGLLQFDGHDLHVGRHLMEATFLDSSLGSIARLLVHNGPHRSAALAQDNWLRDHFSSKREFSWGSVSNSHDYKNSTYSIWFSFKK